MADEEVLAFMKLNSEGIIRKGIHKRLEELM